MCLRTGPQRQGRIKCWPLPATLAGLGGGPVKKFGSGRGEGKGGRGALQEVESIRSIFVGPHVGNPSYLA